MVHSNKLENLGLYEEELHYSTKSFFFSPSLYALEFQKLFCIYACGREAQNKVSNFIFGCLLG